MHPRVLLSEYENKIKKWLDRWQIHPSYAAFLVFSYQDLINKAEHFNWKASEHPDFETDNESGRSLAESSDLMNGLFEHLKKSAQEYMDQHAAHEK